MCIPKLIEHSIRKGWSMAKMSRLICKNPGSEESVTETYAALKLYVDNWRWAGVPFYIQTGKNMPKNRTIVAIRFKHPPKQFFRESQVKKMEPIGWCLGFNRKSRSVSRLRLSSPVWILSLNRHPRRHFER
ncbi:hypothetical protein THIOSC15_230003 [uncultured Thiomicrorhabdus sp.]